MKKVYFVRHGQSQGNVERVFQNPQMELTELGHKQGQAVAKRLVKLKCDALVASPFVRAQQTAEYIASETNLTLETCEYFHELQQPIAIRGLSKDSEEGLDYYKNFYKYFLQPEVYDEGFENFLLIIERAKKCVAYILNHQAEAIAIVSHGTFINLLSAHLMLQQSEDQDSNVAISKSLSRLHNTGITEFDYKNGIWELVTWNDKAHFAHN